MMRLLWQWTADESGATAIEYGIIAAMISVAIIGVLATIGVNLVRKMQDVSDAIAEAGTKAGL
jgi:pilus assembly protein Flp/PilA